MAPSRRLGLTVRIGDEDRLVSVLVVRGAVFFDLNEWRCILCERSGVAARHFTHDDDDDALWRELRLASADRKPGLARRAAEGRYVDRRRLTQLVFALEPTAEGCALIYALSKLELQCGSRPRAAAYLGADPG
jgi:hypothetical protein